MGNIGVRDVLPRKSSHVVIFIILNLIIYAISKKDMKNELNDNFLCKCGHRNKMHTTLEDAMQYYNLPGRMCVEYKDYGNPYRTSEQICHCNDFVPDNLKYLESLNGKF